MFTLGIVTHYQTPNLCSNESCVKDSIIMHNAYVANGSSGGPLLNYKMEIVGINFASVSDDGWKSCAIKIEEVKAFIEA